MNDLNSGYSTCSPSDCASCGGGCGCSGSCGTSQEIPSTITLTLDDDTQLECNVLTIFPVENKEYIALMPRIPLEGQNPGDVYLYAFTILESGDPMLANIEDEAEYDAAANAFNEILRNAQLAASAEPEEETRE